MTEINCPECHGPVTSFRRAHWCSRCEWNLGEYDPDRHERPFGWQRVDRWLYRAAYRLNARQFSALAGQDLAAARTSLVRVAITTASLALFTAVAAMLVGGIVLVVRDFPSFTIIPGGLLILVALALRPRFGGIDPFLEPITRDQAPTLFGLVDRVAAAIDAEPPQVVGVNREINASAGAVGVRRQRVLAIGLPLWALLPPQQRVALLAHELGHFANQDVRRSMLTQPAYTTLGMLAVLTSPDEEDLARADGVLAVLAAYFAHVLMFTVSRVFLTGHLLLLWLGLRDGQRAEYLADGWAVTVAGSAGAQGLVDSLVAAESLAAMVSRAARAEADVAAWRAAAEQTRQELATQLPARHQLSIADQASLFASHPPTGLRRRMVEARPWTDPKVTLSEPESERIDAELAGHFARARRDIGALA